MKVLLTRFHLNGHTIVFHSQTQKLESPYISITDSGSERVEVLLCLRFEFALVLAAASEKQA